MKYCGASAPFCDVRVYVRSAMGKCSLNLSATKTIIAPKQATILVGFGINPCKPLTALLHFQTVSLKRSTDPASGLKQDELLPRQRITIELGRSKNVTKNPFAERAIQELEDEKLRSNPSSPVLTPLTLLLVSARLNTRIRNRELSARESWTQRDQLSNIAHRSKPNHPHSEQTKCPSGKLPVCPDLEIGDIIYLHNIYTM
ncbi:Hypothetical predicted protein [Mytilus galloprovincialis]|uniref:Uncharacterized protein n=1 Tax=Mytilus galloprovincialis TaxID=29158 RepID=A0A8B6BKW1_MYTGA|nr:Hypothetical predicted protein [Mytilus galloprovincialis]